MKQFSGNILVFGVICLACWGGVVLGTARAGPAQETPQVHLQESQLDHLVSAKLESLHISPAPLCSDAVFLRRVYLDVIGTLPSATEAQRFIMDRTPEKRRMIIDGLLARDEFASCLALRWSDLLRIKSEFPINLWPNAAQLYHHWLYEEFRLNVPADQFARELLTSSGSNFELGPVNFYRAMQSRTPAGIAQTVALTFLGERTERWPSNRLAQLAGFFANVGYKPTGEWKEEIVYFNPESTNACVAGQLPRLATFPDGTTVTLTAEQDPRSVFAEWLLKDPQYARKIVNQSWAWLMGRGIVEEPDDFRPDNPPSNAELLAYLQTEFVNAHYNFKALYRWVLNSRTYQRASVAPGVTPEAVANFAAYQVRRLDAEILIDAINQVTGSTERYSSPIPEPYTFIPDTKRSIALPDGSITSPFLEMFGRSPRDTGLESERNNTITAAQKLWLLNSSQFQKKIEQSRMIEFQTSSNRGPVEITRALYLGLLSRFPTAQEIKTAQEHFRSSTGKRQAVVDLAWALMNTTEFICRH